MLTTDQKGSIAETAIIHAAAKLGIGVLMPMAGASATTSCSISAQHSCGSSASGQSVTTG